MPRTKSKASHHANLRRERELRLVRIERMIALMREMGETSSTPLAPGVGCEPSSVRTYFQMMQVAGVARPMMVTPRGSVRTFALTDNEEAMAEFLDLLRHSIVDLSIIVPRLPDIVPEAPVVSRTNSWPLGQAVRDWAVAALFGPAGAAA